MNDILNRLIVVVLIGLVLVGLAPTGCKTEVPVPPIPPSVEEPDVDALLLELVKRHNKARAASRLPALNIDAKLMRAANHQAAYMAVNKAMTHIGEGNTNVGQRLTAVDYYYQSCGENIAYGYRSVSSVMNGWLNSQGHKDNIMNPHYTDVGVAVAADEHGVPYWCVVFGRAAAAGRATGSTLPEQFSPPAIFADATEITDNVGVSKK